MSHENKSYWDQISKLTAERNELATLLSDVLDAWVEEVAFDINNYTLYVKANEYLIGLEDE